MLPRFPIPHRLTLCILALAAVACDSPTEPAGPRTQVVDEYRADNVLFTASARALGDGDVEVTLTAMNETDFSAQTGILGGNCMLRPRVYAKRGGQLLWSAFDLFDACQEPLRVFQLGGGDEESISADFEMDLEDGLYFVTLSIDHVGELVELAAGEVSIF